MNFHPKKVCTCSLCSAGDYNPADYQVDISGFKKERPVGVSGLMRVKNEARWVAQSIDTCIDALDELIICYQACTDETPEIIEQKRQQYPDKIKVFFYAPPVYAFELSKKDFDYACKLPEDSIHHFSNYTNYVLSKASFRYAVKIDADQIYFSKRITALSEAYRDIAGSKRSFSACLAFGYYRLFLFLGQSYPELFFRMINFLPFKGKIMKKYWKYICAQISRTKKPVFLSGINLYKGKKGWGIPAFADRDDFLFPFNGVGDLMFFTISDQSYYYPLYQTMKPEEVTDKIRLNSDYTSRRIIEAFHLKGDSPLYGGFCWYHMKFMDLKETAGHPICEKVDFKTFFSSSLSELIDRKLLSVSLFRCVPHLFSLVYDKEIPDPDHFMGKYDFSK